MQIEGDEMMEKTIAKQWVLRNHNTWLAEFNARWHAGIKRAANSIFRYVTYEEERILYESKSAYERVLEQAAQFQKKESALWILNNQLYARALVAEAEVRELKDKIRRLETTISILEKI